MFHATTKQGKGGNLYRKAKDQAKDTFSILSFPILFYNVTNT